MTEKKTESNLAAALARAQAKMKKAARSQTAQGQGKTYKYADLASIREAAGPLADEGIAFEQDVSSYLEDNGMVCVQCVTILEYGGERRVSSPFRIWSTTDPHSIGSAGTYSKKYSLMGFIGLAAEGEDDDAQNLQREVKSQPSPQREAPKQEPARPAEPTKQEPPKPQGPRVNLDRLERDIQRLPASPEAGEARAAILSVLQAWPDEMRSDVLTKLAGEPTTVTRLKGLSPDRNLELWTALRSAAIGVLERNGRNIEPEAPKEQPKEEPKAAENDPVDDFLQEAGS